MAGKQLNPFQHVLVRPDTYVGSVETVDTVSYVLDSVGKIEKKSVKYNVGLFNIIREIGSNAIDNMWRSQKSLTKMKYIHVSYNSETGAITFTNDGEGIPVVKTKYEYTDHHSGKVIIKEFYPAELYFGEMLAGTNFEDNQIRKTSGRNGMGAKATNILSVKFEIVLFDPENKKKYHQVFTKNGSKRTEPKITQTSNKTGKTEISFIPDFKRFGYVPDENFAGLLGVYVLELAAMTGLPVQFTVDKKVQKFQFKTFDKYAQMFYPNVKNSCLIKLPNGDECVIIESFQDKSQEDLTSIDSVYHTSFVNGIKTIQGGVHVQAWRDFIFSTFTRMYNIRKSPTVGSILKTSAKEVYPYISLFIKTEVDKPSFSTQTKEYLTSPKYTILPSENKEKVKTNIEKEIKKMFKWDFIILLDEKLSNKQVKQVKLKPTKKRIGHNDKILDANLANNPNAECTLYITEGLSAKAMVVRGVSELQGGLDYNGILAIQGKFINPTNATPKELLENTELSLLKELLNLHDNVDYSKEGNFNTLRYKRIRIMTDMDNDGIHIKGLLLNCFYELWPTLLERKIVDSLSTAVCKVTFTNNTVLLFYNSAEYEKWIEKNPNDQSKIDVKYIKGLGSINPKDVPGYFNNPKTVKYFFNGKEDYFMKLGFDERYSDERKEWIIDGMIKESEIQTEIEKEKPLDFKYDGQMSVSDVVSKQLIIPHRANLSRSIPSIIDGLVVAQRKSFYAIRKRNYQKPVDLEKVCGAIKELSVYHHGATSLLGVVCKMAARYPGSNNIPLLKNDGEFGTRLEGGKDAAAARYISTKLEDISNLIFKTEDDAILTQTRVDNEDAEYKFFIPIICMILVNGAEGIATGYSTFIPNYNPLDILNWQRVWLKNEHLQQPKLVPWYNGISGPIELEGTRFRTKGIIQSCHKNCKIFTGKNKCKGEPGWYHIRDLPVGVWTTSFKRYLDSLENGPTEKEKSKKKTTKLLSAYKDYSNVDLVHLMIKPIPDSTCIQEITKKLETTKSLTNMVAIDGNNYPERYDSVEMILEKWCNLRFKWFNIRKQYQLEKLTFDCQKAYNKSNFVKLVTNGKLSLKQEYKKLYSEMIKMNFKKLPSSFRGDNSSFDYLFNMQMSSMVSENVTKLEKERVIIKNKIDELKNKTTIQIWEDDMDEFEKGYKKYLETVDFH